MAALKIVAFVIAGSVAMSVSAIAGAHLRWRTASNTAVRELRHSSARGTLPTHYDPSETRELPAPVARYFAFALTPHQPIVTGARLLQTGTFALRPDQWTSFTAVEEFAVHPPGFVWDASITMAPLVSVHVRDSYRNGQGSMLAKLGTLVPMVDQHGSSEIAVATLQRYLAEAPWIPTALLPSAGIVWTPIDDSTARATLVDHGVSASIEVHFGVSGEIVRITAMRYRDVDGAPVLTPWEGRSFDYGRVSGMMVPLRSEVGWHLPDGWTPYWRGHTVHARLDLAIGNH